LIFFFSRGGRATATAGAATGEITSGFAIAAGGWGL